MIRWKGQCSSKPFQLVTLLDFIFFSIFHNFSSRTRKGISFVNSIVTSLFMAHVGPYTMASGVTMTMENHSDKHNEKENGVTNIDNQ